MVESLGSQVLFSKALMFDCDIPDLAAKSSCVSPAAKRKRIRLAAKARCSGGALPTFLGRVLLANLNAVVATGVGLDAELVSLLERSFCRCCVTL